VSAERFSSVLTLNARQNVALAVCSVPEHEHYKQNLFLRVRYGSLHKNSCGDALQLNSMSGGLDHSKEYIGPTSLHPFTIHSGQFHNAPKAGSPFASISPKTLTNQLIITKNRDRRLTEKKAEPSISSSIWLRGRRGTYSWYTEVVNQYVDQNLTFEKDKLVALTVIANKIAGLSGCQYIVGLWSEDIQHGLAW
jgi:hypothetical protein